MLATIVSDHADPLQTLCGSYCTNNFQLEYFDYQMLHYILLICNLTTFRLVLCDSKADITASD